MRLSLNGSDWQFKDYIGEDWRWRDAHLPVTRDTRHWHTATVPGSVHHDLLQHGLIPDVYRERNTLLAEWVSDRTWLYRKTFIFDVEQQGQRVELVFEGVDYEAEFFLNGVSLGHHRSMYTPARFDVSSILIGGGENVLAVVLQPAPYEEPQVGRTSHVRTHKSRMTYWWDFCPRLVQLGIWDTAYLNITGAARIEDVMVRPQLNAEFTQAALPVIMELSSTEATTVTAKITITHNDSVITATTSAINLHAGSNTAAVELALENPRLWWPNGHGDQPLYEASVQIILADGRVSDQRRVRFGVRQLDFVPNETPDVTARPYTLVVNGQKIYLNGWNWVPLDVLYGVERPAKLRHLLTLARRANVNLLRVWGGGLIERETFYDLCDEFGLLIWQEFIQSSSGIDNVPPESPEMIALMVNEAEQIIPRRRNHPALALWCGGNELQIGVEQPCDDHQPLLGALRDVVRRLDPGRYWLPTSPTGRCFSNSLDNILHDPTALHDVHGPWEYQGLIQQYTLYNHSTSLLHSEFGAEAITNLRTLQAVMDNANRWPVTLDNPTWFHLGAWWVKEHQWREALGEIHDLETLVRGTQYLQAEGVRYAVEANRRRMFQNSGTLPWQFNEPYPMAACTSAVDYYARPKPLYHAVARAYEPIHLSAKFAALIWTGQAAFEAEVWLSNATPQVREGHMVAQLVSLAGEIYARHEAEAAIAGQRSAAVAHFTVPLADVDDVFLLDMSLFTNDRCLSRNQYLFTRADTVAPALNAAPTTLHVDTIRADDAWQIHITNTGQQAALWVWLEDDRTLTAAGYVYFDHNYFCLLPGERRVVSAHWQAVPPSDRQVGLSAWNVPKIVIRP